MSKAHSSLGASIAHRWTVCTASVKACAGIPKPPSSIHAEEGTAAHSLGERCLREELVASHFLGQTITTESGTPFEVTEEMAEAVQVYLDTVREIKGVLKGSILLIEHQFDLSRIYPGMYGTCDAVIIQPFGRVVVIDYKHGAGKWVDVEQNPQAMFYGLGALTHPKAVGAEEVELIIVQPRAAGAPVRRWLTTPDDLETFGETLKRKAIEAMSDRAQFTAGDHCQWCPYAPHCGAIRGEVTAVARVPDPAFQPVVISPPDPCLLTGEQIDKILSWRGVFESWLDSVAEHAKARLRQGQAVAGWKLVEGKASRKWTDEKIVVDSLPANVIYERKMRSPAQVEKALKELKLDPKQIAPLITTTRGVSLAPAEDPRPALNVSPGFTPISNV